MLVTNGIVKMLLRTMRREKIIKRIGLLARIKLNVIEKTISKAMIDSDISYEKFKRMINREQTCFTLK